VGKAVKSSGRFIISAVIRISTALVIEIASSMSSRKAGTGRINRTTIPTTPTASATSPRATQAQISRGVGAALRLGMEMSAMVFFPPLHGEGQLAGGEQGGEVWVKCRERGGSYFPTPDRFAVVPSP
jgi:hypothetical protein